MKIRDIGVLLDGNFLTADTDMEREVSGGLACDLLSWVVGNSCPGCAFITIQTSINTIAVASLMDISCVIIVENAKIDMGVIAKAQEEGIPVFQTSMSAFIVCGILYENGLRSVCKNEAVC